VRRPQLGAALVVVAVLAGCGGTKDGSKVASKADFIAAADKICIERDARSKQLAREPNSNVGRLSGELADAYATAIAKVEALDLPPGAARPGAAKYVKSVTDMRRPVQRMKAAATTFAAATSVSQIKAAGAELQRNVNTVQAISDLADQNARTYGMKSCGQQQSLPVT
jgi:hypothetical protein